MAILPDVVGKTIDDFEIKSLIGMGAMGAVYKAVHVIERYEVALKVLPVALAEDRENLKRFQREAQTVAALVHPHIVQVYGYGNYEGMSYIVMKHLPGRTLLHWIYDHRGKLTPLDDIVVWLNAIASALDYAHQHGVIHRDIKPNNVMFDDRGHLYVVDFGIAKVSHATSTLTETGTKLGTPQYMAPEQWMAQQAVPATDQYAVGAMVYHLVTGEMPFVAETPLGLLHLHLNERPKPPHRVREDVPPALEVILNVAMAKSSDYRFSTITSFARAFEEVIETGEYSGTLPAAPDTLPLGLEPVKPSVETISLPDTVTNEDEPVEDGETKRRRPSAAYLSTGVLFVVVVIFGLIILLNGNGEDDPTGVAGNNPSETPSVTVSVTPFDGQVQLGGATEVAVGADEASPTDEASATIEPSETPEPTETHTLEPSATNTQTATTTPTSTLTATPTITVTASLTSTITPTPTPFYDQAELLKAISVYPDPLDEEPRTFAAAQRSGFAPFVVGRAFVPDEDNDDELVEWYYIYYYDRGSARSGRGDLTEGWSRADELEFDEDDIEELDFIDPENTPDLPDEFEYHVRAERPYGGGVVAATNGPSSDGGTNTSSGGNTGGDTGGGGGTQPTAPPGEPTYTPIPPPSLSISANCNNVILNYSVSFQVNNSGGPMPAPAPYNMTWPLGGSGAGNVSLGAGGSTTLTTGSTLLGGSHSLTITMPDGPVSASLNCP
jgi:serine/threonine protein kinase